MKAKIIAFGIVLVLLLSATVGMASALSDSGGGDWKYYKELAVKENSGKSLTDFQVLVELNPANFPANAKSDGSDLRFAEVEKEPVSLRQHAEEFLGGCYETAKILPKAVIEHPREAATVGGVVIAAPFFLNAAGIGGVNVASASSDSGSDIPEDYYDETQEWFEYEITIDIMDYCKGFKAVGKPLNEPIKTPDDIMKMLKDNIDYDKEIIKTVKVSPTDFAVWIGVASDEKLVKPYLVYIDTDGDNKPEELVALYNYPYANWVAVDEFEPQIQGHFVKARGGYVINPFDAPENLGGVHKLVYIENPDKIQVLPDKTIPWYEAVGKTLKELGLDKYDKKILGGTPDKSPTPHPEEIPTGEEEGIPGFGAIVAVAGLLAVAYLLRRKKWLKKQ